MAQHFDARLWLSLAWALGAAGIALWVCASHFSVRRMILKCARPADASLKPHLRWACTQMGVTHRVALLEIPELPTVALSGWLRPRILVPPDLLASYSADEVRGMLLHELAHVRRHDVLWTWVGIAACALHWFNPLAWLTLRRFRADRELDCDRLALDKLTEPQRRSYGFALLKTLETHLAPAPVVLVPFGQTQPNIQTRIHMIATPPRSHWVQRLALLILPALALVTFTTARADGDKKDEPKTAVEKEKDGAKPKTGARDGEQKVARDSDAPPKGPRDGEVKKEGQRDGDGRRKSKARDGEERKAGPRDGDAPKKGPRDGEVKREGARDGEAKKTGPRDGDAPRKGPRDGEVKREGARDGDAGAKKAGPRDGDRPVNATRDGDKPKEGAER